jgi:hypothetical protein
MFKAPEKYRVVYDNKNAYGYSDESYGNNGVFFIMIKKSTLKVVCSDGGGWDHVSVSNAGGLTPTWDQMCEIKDLFWGDEDCVVQFHPPKSDYVNIKGNCLHLWKHQTSEFNRPPSLFV